MSCLHLSKRGNGYLLAVGPASSSDSAEMTPVMALEASRADAIAFARRYAAEHSMELRIEGAGKDNQL